MVSNVVVGINPPDGKWLQQCQKVIQIFILPCSKCKRKRGIGCMIYRPPQPNLMGFIMIKGPAEKFV